jgi:ketosteroid isomerase-like protein
MNATSMQTVKSGVDATNRAFEKAYNQGDAAGAAAVYSSSGQALPPNGATVSGRAALQSFWQAVMDAGIKSVKLETLELELCGDMAYEVGKATLSGEGGAVADVVKFVVVWKQEDGQWKWHRDIWNSNSPA